MTIGPIRCHHHVHRVQVAVHEPITRQRSNANPWWRRNPVEPLVKIREQVPRPANRKRWPAEHIHQRRTLESVHHEVPVTDVVHLRTRIATRSGITHHLGFGFERASIAGDAEDLPEPVFEDLAVATLGDLRPDRLHTRIIQASPSLTPLRLRVGPTRLGSHRIVRGVAAGSATHVAQVRTEKERARRLATEESERTSVRTTSTHTGGPGDRHGHSLAAQHTAIVGKSCRGSSVGAAPICRRCPRWRALRGAKSPAS